MSLLLDALKKSGDNQQQSTGLSNLTLEEASSSRTSSSSTTASSRVAGGTMFAAKKNKSAGFQWKLGLVPTTLLLALIFGSGYGYYVWLEIQPPFRCATASVRRAIPGNLSTPGSVHSTAGKINPSTACTATGHGAKRRFRRAARQVEPWQTFRQSRHIGR